MARKWSNQNLPGALHFVTANFFDRVPVFKQQRCCEAFITTLATLLDEWPCKLIAYVLMPDHTHFIVNPKDGRIEAKQPLEVDREWSWPDDGEKLSKAMKELGWRTYHKRN
jgi:hypothetical protein